MIVRVLRGRVPAERVTDFRDQARRLLLPDSSTEGLLNAHVGRQVHTDGSEEIVFVTVWVNLESVYRWIGGRNLLETPVLSERPDLFKTFDVQHYEVIELADAVGSAVTKPAEALLVEAEPLPTPMGTSV